TDGVIDSLLQYGGEISTFSHWSQSMIFRHGGAVSAVPNEDTAFSHRGAAYMAHIIAGWENLSETERYLDWVRRFSAAIRPAATGGVYLNFEPAEGEDKVRAGFGVEKYAKLTALKAKWDPLNLFHLNQNIRPS